MKRQISDLTKDSNDAKGSIPSEIEKICGITEESPVPTKEATNEYRNDDLDITFVDNQILDLGSDKKQGDYPFDIKNVDVTKQFDTTTSYMNEVIAGNSNESQALSTSSKLLHDKDATFITP